MKAVRKVLLGLAVTVGLGLAPAVYAGPFGDGVAAYDKGDYATAVRLLKLAADQGHARAQFNLGLMYFNGEGVTQNYQEAARLYKLAADQGLANAPYNLGWMYFNGEGVTQNYQEAVRLFKLAADQGHAQAQFNLGHMYGNGRGVTQDYILAHMWFNLAASSLEGHAGKGAHNRDIAAGRMTAAQIVRAQSLARVCQASNFKKCDYGLTPHEQTCAGYGFKKGASNFGQCLMQLDGMQQQAQLAQQQYALQQQQYEQEVAAYNAQQEAIKKERDRQKWAALGRFGFGMAASNSPYFSGGVADGLRALNGQPPLPPPIRRIEPPSMQNYTIRLPNGDQVYCSSNGNYMTCR